MSKAQATGEAVHLDDFCAVGICYPKARVGVNSIISRERRLPLRLTRADIKRND